MTIAASLPNPDPSDPSDVAVAIEAARALWENGDTTEALRWFSRAAEAAEQAGNDRRALELARTVAELRDGLGSAQASTPPKSKSVAPPPAPSARRPSLPPTPPSMRPRPPEASSKSAPPPPSMRPRPPEAIPKSAPPPSIRPQSPEPAPAKAAASAPSTSPKPPSSLPPPLPGASASAKPAPESPRAPRDGGPAKPAPSPERPPPEKAPIAAAAAPAPKPKAAASSEDGVRVSVKPSVRDPQLLIVRILRKGQAVPSGCHEAFLSPTEQGIDFGNLRG